MAEETPKHPGGRPTDYDPAYCDKVIEWGKLGKSKAWIAASLGCTKQTLLNWTKANPEFLYAMDQSQALAQAVWEDKGEIGMETPGFSASIWSRSMSARFPDDWRENSTTTVQNPDGSNLMDPVAALLAEISNKTRSL